MSKVLILGGIGYVGSRLTQVLAEKHDVDSVDICWHSNDDSLLNKRDYHHLTKKELAVYDAIVCVAGHSSVKTCDGHLAGPWLNNVTNFKNLLDKVDDQLVIYASSSSVYGNSEPGQLHREDQQHFVPVNNYDVTKYALDQVATIANLRGKRVIGLRFGTVNGWSPRIRCDVMLNAMYTTVVRNNDPIQVFNKHISRAILGLEDLCRAIDHCIQKPTPGIYNLASFNDTVANMANTVAKILKSKLQDNGNTAGAYDFAIDTSLFQKTFDFEFKETTESIITGLQERYPDSEIHYRNHYIIYQWEKPYEYNRKR